MIDTGICFGDIHSYYDLGLVLSKTDIPPATPKTNYIDIPGGDGSIDLTEVHGAVKYNDRECKFTFTVAKSINESEWEDLKTNVNNALNGKKFKITLDKDPDYYYLGRCSINEYSVNKRLRQIVVNAKVAPWKYKQTQTIIMVGAGDFHLPNAKKTVFPLTVESEKDGIRVVFDNSIEFELDKGTNTLSYELKEGGVDVRISGAGRLRFIYQEGDL